MSPHVRAAAVGSEINLLINIILLITYLPWVFLKYQMLLCKHHSYLDRLSHTLPPPLSHLSPSCDAPRMLTIPTPLDAWENTVLGAAR